MLTLETLARLHPGSPWLGTLDDQLERVARGLHRVSLDPLDAERLSAAIRRARARVAMSMAAAPRTNTPEVQLQKRATSCKRTMTWVADSRVHRDPT